MVVLEYLKRISYTLEFEIDSSKYSEMMANPIDAAFFAVLGSCGDGVYLETIVSRRKVNKLLSLLNPYFSIQELELIEKQMEDQELAYPKV